MRTELFSVILVVVIRTKYSATRKTREKKKNLELDFFEQKRLRNCEGN